MEYAEIRWDCDGQELAIGLDRAGAGPRVLMLPALSSISTRREMYPLQCELTQSHTVISIDWPGFGGLSKPRIDWRPEIYDRFLDDLLMQIRPQLLVAAGHAAGYALRCLAKNNHGIEQLVLLSPTWRGPLPTMMGGDRSIFQKMAKAFDPPVFGSLLYGLNVNRFVVGMMARGHVYADPAWLNTTRMLNKLAITRTRGARHASARFVTGRLDPFGSREELQHIVQRMHIPLLNLYSDNVPRKSRLEMAALAEMPNVITRKLPQGKLSFYEEFPGETAKVIQAFFDNHTGNARPIVNPYRPNQI